MNAIELKYSILSKLGRIPNFSHPGFDDRELSLFANDAQDRILFHYYNSLGNKYKEGFEGNESRKRNLAELVNSAWIPLFDDDLTATPSDSFTYTCVASDYILTGDNAIGRKVTISANTIDINTLVDSSIIESRDTLIMGLTKGMIITGTNGNLNSFTIVNIISETEIEVDGDATGMISFVGGLGLSSTQYGSNSYNTTIKGYFVDLPVNMLYAIQESVVTNEESTTLINVQPKTHDYITANKNNPFKKPDSSVIWRVDVSGNIHSLGDTDGTFDSSTGVYQRAKSSKRVELIVDADYKPILYFLRYVKYPRRIVIDEVNTANNIMTELDESIHNDIVDETVNIITATIQPEKYNVTSNEANKSE